jgi:hypothetical protein
MPMPSRRTRRFILLAVLVLLAGAIAVPAYRIALVGSGFAAKNVCSAVFVSGRAPEDAMDDLRAYRSTPLDLVQVVVERDRQTATGALFGLARREAVYREGLGCALAIGASPEALRSAALPLRGRPAGFLPGPLDLLALDGDGELVDVFRDQHDGHEERDDVKRYV